MALSSGSPILHLTVSRSIASLEEATRAGTSLIYVDSRFLDPTLDKLLGLKFKDFYTSTDTFRSHRSATSHAKSRPAKMPPSAQSHDYSDRLWVQPDDRGNSACSGPTPRFSP